MGGREKTGGRINLEEFFLGQLFFLERLFLALHTVSSCCLLPRGRATAGSELWLRWRRRRSISWRRRRRRRGQQSRRAGPSSSNSWPAAVRGPASHLEPELSQRILQLLAWPHVLLLVSKDEKKARFCGVGVQRIRSCHHRVARLPIMGGPAGERGNIVFRVSG